MVLTMTCTAETDMPLWVMVFERIGPGSAILVFTGAILWKLLPAILKLVSSWKKQSDTITAAIPGFQASVTRIADNMEKGFERLNEKLYIQKRRGEDGG